MLDFSVKDIIDILLVGALLYYIYRLMKESGAINVFYGVLAFIVVWLFASEIFDMRLTGSILDKFMNIGLLILVILFQDQIKRFLIAIGSHRRLKVFKRLFTHGKGDETSRDMARVMPIVYACMSMSKSKTGALIVVQQRDSLEEYAKSGDIIDACVNTRLIENIFFKNSPLHDGAMIIANGRIRSAGCILPVSHDSDIPRSLGLRHRSALGVAQATDALAIIVSEETGGISLAQNGKLRVKVATSDLEHALSALPL